jgi:hypothetical protein
MIPCQARGEVSAIANTTREDIKCVVPDKRPRDEGEGPPFVCSRDSCEEIIRFSKSI